MILERLEARSFRNYESLTVEPGPGVNVFVGDNAQGKSNILEAIYLLATTKSFRTSRDTEVIRSGSSETVINGNVRREDELSAEVEIRISETERKSARINGARAARAVDLLGVLQAVFFGALDLRLVNGEPAARRNYMNLAISQVKPAYCNDLGSYRRVLLHRNSLLKRLRDQWFCDNGLEAWNQQLALYGSRLIGARRLLADEVARLAGTAHEELSGGLEEFTVAYVPSPSVPEAAGAGDIMSAFLDTLARLSEEEIRRGTTLAGPQRDDLRFRINGMEVRTYGSQGQQRTAVLSLKLAELSFIEAASGERPVMLLDDVMSDLDDERRTRLMERVKGRCQVFITCTNLRGFSSDLLENAAIFDVAGGTVQRRSA